jgi:hypothetical protein
MRGRRVASPDSNDQETMQKSSKTGEGQSSGLDMTPVHFFTSNM